MFHLLLLRGKFKDNDALLNYRLQKNDQKFTFQAICKLELLSFLDILLLLYTYLFS